MTDIKQELIEAGARAIGEHRKGHGWERDEDTWRNYTQIVEWALAAIEPLIRAQIAADIEADKASRTVSLCVGTQDAYNRAARIARGDN